MLRYYRRHTPPIFVEVFSNHRKSLAAFFSAGPENHRSLRLLPLRQPALTPNNVHSSVARASALAGFFSPAKVNARNAP